MIKGKSLVAFVLLVSSCTMGNFMGRLGPKGSPATSVGEAHALDDGKGVIEINTEGQAILPEAAEVKKFKEQCLSAATRLQTLTRVIKYPEREDCNFGVYPNIGPIANVNTAREISHARLDLPPGKICDLEMQSSSREHLQYDDFLILTLAGQIIFASNQDLLLNLQAQQSIYTWNFDRIVGQNITDFDEVPYCLGSIEKCRLPGSEEEGPFTLNLSSRDLAPVALALVGKSSADLDLIATGDDNDEDCYHSNLELKVTIRYLSP